MEIKKGPEEKGRKFFFFGHFGSGNFGNEITFGTVLYHLRLRSREAEFACICTNPEVLAATQKIRSIPVSRGFGGPKKRRKRLTRVLGQIFVGVPRELYRWFEAFKTLRGADMLIVPGTGLLTDAYGLHGWGPYNLFKWSLMAKLRGAKLWFLSVGAGPLYSRPGKWLIKSALFMADFRSYRDDASMNWLKAIGFQTNSDRIYPDLVFSLPEAMLPNNNASERPRPVVGLGVMSYAGKYSVAEPKDATYRQYLESLVAFAQWLLARNYDIRLLIGEAGDWTVLEEFKSLLKTGAAAYDKERIMDCPAHSVEELLPQIAETDIVVATRFHNVLLSLVLNKPVIAISFHHKCDSLMREMGLPEYIHDINAMNADKLIEQFRDVEKKTERLKSHIRGRVEQSRKALDEQYNLIFKAESREVPADFCRTGSE